MSDLELPLDTVIARVAKLVRGMMQFWKSSSGWAPVDAAELLSNSMLDWQSSLADALQRWNGPLTDGELILAWANIGALVEGQLKLFLSVYYDDYMADVEAIKKGGEVASPDGVTLEPLRVYFKKKIWVRDEPWDEWILMIQQRRNAIHAYKYRDIGTATDLHKSIRQLLRLVRSINDRLPYPGNTSPQPMKLQFPESAIKTIAARYSYGLDDSESIKLAPLVQKRGYLDRGQLKQVAQWKSPRRAGRVEDNETEFVKEVTSWAFKTTNERARVESLTILNGIGWASATVILHFYHRDPYPILDFRAIEAVGLKEPNQYSFSFGRKYRFSRACTLVFNELRHVLSAR